MLTDANFKDLTEKGYTVIPGVVSHEECDDAINFFKEWLKQFKDGFPDNYNNIIDGYNAGHLEATWNIRLKAKPVFAQLWKTEKLLTSFDAIGIGRAPEDGHVKFQEPGKYWLHTDQTSRRKGLHAYQGTVFLEEQCEDDWTFQVMEGSHRFMDEYFENDPELANLVKNLGAYELQQMDIDLIERLGCKTQRIPVPKGGMVVWDSRLVHANARPLENRKHPGRCRFVVFVSMTPAIWASPFDVAEHKQAYNEAKMSTHWSSQKISTFGDDEPCDGSIKCPTEVPAIARTEEARYLSGDLEYDFEDGAPNGGNYRPEWRTF